MTEDTSVVDQAAEVRLPEGDFYEDDQPIDRLLATFGAGEKAVTRAPVGSGAADREDLAVVRAVRAEGGELISHAEVVAEHIAQAFHDTYERLAPAHGYETREASTVAWENVPDGNRALMIATVAALVEDGVITTPGDPVEVVYGPADEHCAGWGPHVHEDGDTDG